MKSRSTSLPEDEAPAADSGIDPVRTTDLGKTARKVEYAFGPIVAGLIIDFVDLVTFGPIGLMFGIVAGVTAGWWIGSIYRLHYGYRFLIALASGIYCTIPGTELIPVATIIGAFIRFNQEPPERDRR